MQIIIGKIVVLFLIYSINIFPLEKKEENVLEQLPSKEEQLKIIRKKWNKVIEEAAHSYNFKLGICEMNNFPSLKCLEEKIIFFQRKIQKGKSLVQKATKDYYKEDIIPGILALEKYLETLYVLQSIFKREKINH